MVQGEPEADPAAQRLALDVGPLHAQRVEQVDELLAVGVERSAVGWLRRVAVPDEVDRQRAVALPEPRRRLRL